MRTALLTLILLLSVIAYGQNESDESEEKRPKPPTTLYLGIQPIDLGVAFRTDVHPWSWVGFYGSIAYGQWYFYKDSGMDQHVKGGLGVLVTIASADDYSLSLSGAFNYHWVSGGIDPESMFYEEHPRFNSPYSCEVGWVSKIHPVALGVTYDFLRKESCVYFGYTLGNRKNHE